MISNSYYIKKEDVDSNLSLSSIIINLLDQKKLTEHYYSNVEVEIIHNNDYEDEDDDDDDDDDDEVENLGSRSSKKRHLTITLVDSNLILPSSAIEIDITSIISSDTSLSNLRSELVRLESKSTITNEYYSQYEFNLSIISGNAQHLLRSFKNLTVFTIKSNIWDSKMLSIAEFRRRIYEPLFVQHINYPRKGNIFAFFLRENNENVDNSSKKMKINHSSSSNASINKLVDSSDETINMSSLDICIILVLLDICSNDISGNGIINMENELKYLHICFNSIDTNVESLIPPVMLKQHVEIEICQQYCLSLCNILNININPKYLQFLGRCSASLRRNNYSNNKNSSTVGSLKFNICKVIGDGISATSNNMYKRPTQQEGIKVFEFFSGIGGMRLALPNEINGIPIKNITAFDCSDPANNVYAENFHNEKNIDQSHHIDGKLRRILIDGLKLNEVDGQFDVMTLSPPCQPFTTTRDAHQLDEKDNRSRGIFHLMHLLLNMNSRPRWIVLENVQGFLNSEVLKIWKKVLKKCGYKWKQFLISPVYMNLPNNRMRYYMTAELVIDDICCFTEEDREIVFTTLPSSVLTNVPDMPVPIGSFILNKERKEELLIPISVLSALWAPNRLSIVGNYDCVSYCFTKSYGKKFDKASGSFYYENAKGLLSVKEFAIDRNNLASLSGSIRFFDPDEMLLISGFPTWFKFPENFPLTKKFSCIGNSVNVTVVRAVMQSMFNNDR